MTGCKPPSGGLEAPTHVVASRKLVIWAADKILDYLEVVHVFI